MQKGTQWAPLREVDLQIEERRCVGNHARWHAIRPENLAWPWRRGERIGYAKGCCVDESESAVVPRISENRDCGPLGALEQVPDYCGADAFALTLWDD